MSTISKLWIHDHPLDKTIRYVLKCLNAVFRSTSYTKQILSHGDFLANTPVGHAGIVINLPKDTAYVEAFSTRTSSVSLQKQIILDGTNVISPLAGEDVSIIAKPSPADKETVDLIHIRRSTLQALENASHNLEAVDIRLSQEGFETVQIPLPAIYQRKIWLNRFITLAVFSCAIGSYLLASSIVTRHEKSAENYSLQERLYRQAALERVDANAAVGALSALQDQSAETQTPMARLNLLSKITAATPQTAWWSSISINKNQLNLEGFAPRPSDVAATLAQGLPEYEIAVTATSTRDNRIKVTANLKAGEP